jgi:hypothetical protein
MYYTDFMSQMTELSTVIALRTSTPTKAPYALFAPHSSQKKLFSLKLKTMQIQMINIKVRMVKNFCVPILQEELKA